MRGLGMLFLGGVLIALLSVIGCGSSIAPVKGTVKYDGRIVDEGAIAFYSADGKGTSEGGLIKNGQYTVQAPVGATKVTISWPKTYEKKKLYADDPNSPFVELKRESLPDKYHDALQTELTFEVKSGSNQKDWDLVK
jgi:hypothetical protein